MNQERRRFRITYQQGGKLSGRPLLFLHGAGLSREVWQKQLSHFHKDYCLAPDLPGHGRLHTETFNSPGVCAGVMAQFCREKCGDRKVHLIGTSLGAQVALLLMHQVPHLIASSLLFSCQVQPSRTRYRRLLAGLRALPGQSRQEVLASYRAARIHRDLVEPVYQARLRAVAGNFKQIYKATCLFHLPGNFSSQGIPALLLAGSEEETVIHKSLVELRERLAGARAYQLQGATGAFLWQNPHLFNQILEAWLEQTPLPGNLIPVRA